MICAWLEVAWRHPLLRMAMATGGDKETFGQRLARLRKSRGVTQVDLAEAVGLGQPNVSDYERDVCRPNADMLAKIAVALKLSADELLGLSSPKNAPKISRKLVKRMIEIERLPRRDQQALLRTIDAFLSKAS